MPVYTIGKTNIAYKLERREDITRRYIEVTPHQVLVTVHIDDTSREIEGFLKKKERWLFDTTSSVRKAYVQRHTVHHFTTGVKIPYRGRRVSLKVTRKKSPSIEVLYKNGLHVLLPDYIKSTEQDLIIEDALRLWLKKQMRRDVETLLRHYAEKHGLNAKGFRAKQQKHMWGSCGKDGVINLNWHLIFAPKSVLEYAVVHELCHLKHRTHGPAFWRFLRSILPEFEKSKTWLEKNEHFLGYELYSNK